MAGTEIALEASGKTLTAVCEYGSVVVFSSEDSSEDADPNAYKAKWKFRMELLVAMADLGRWKPKGHHDHPVWSAHKNT